MSLRFAPPWAVAETELVISMICLLAIAAIASVFQHWARHSGAFMHPNASADQTGDRLYAEADRMEAERRKFHRRGGTPVGVRVIDLHEQQIYREAVILDRSFGGLRLAIPVPIEIGTKIQIRAHDANGVPWVLATVRNIRPNEEVFEIGCEFDCPPPASVMATFG